MSEPSTRVRVLDVEDDLAEIDPRADERDDVEAEADDHDEDNPWAEAGVTPRDFL